MLSQVIRRPAASRASLSSCWRAGGIHKKRWSAQAFLFIAIPALACAAARPHELLYVSPRPDAKLVRAETSIIVRWEHMEHADASLLNTMISARGGSSGDHPGTVVLSDDNRTVIFRPLRPFHPGENVRVTLRGPGGSVFAYSFSVSPGPAPRPQAVQVDPCIELSAGFPGAVGRRLMLPQKAGPLGVTPDGPLRGQSPFAVSIPSDFPPIGVSIQGETAEGRLFFSNWGGTPYLIIAENDGTPVFYRRMPSFARDFKVQRNGLLSYFVGGEILTFYIMDSSYTVRDSVVCTNGYETDEHELLILPDGHFLLIGKDYQKVDMSQYVIGGQPDATVIGNIVQELDRNHQLVFEWRSWDHFEITDCDHISLRAATIDYVHMNAIDLDEDGNLLLSSRNMSEITKIDRTTGEIIWRWGGKKSMFSLVNDPIGFVFQHDIRSIGEGHYTLYDNGNYHDPPESRAVEYQIDTAAMTATLVWQYSHNPIRYSWWLGSVQRLPNGNTLIGWGDASLPVLTEVRPDGSIACELEFEHYAHSYRAFRFPWVGKASRPYLLAEAHNDTARLFMNTFGDTSVVSYRIYGGTTPGSPELLDSSASAIHNLLGLDRGVRYYIRVAGVDTSGTQGLFSEEVSIQLRSSEPGDDMVLNGDFSHGLDEWTFVQNEGAIARAWITEQEECRVDISDGGPQTWSVQLKQEGFELHNGRDYLFEFRARASASRSIEVRIEDGALAGKNYSRTGTTYVARTWRQYSFSFTMLDPTDVSARMVFNCGKSNAEVFFDNISLREVIPSDVVLPETGHPSVFALRAAYPNPFNPSTQLAYDVPEPARIQITLFTVLGQVAKELLDEQREPGRHTLQFDARDLASGVYVCRLSATVERTGARIHSALKLMLLR